MQNQQNPLASNVVANPLAPVANPNHVNENKPQVADTTDLFSPVLHEFNKLVSKAVEIEYDPKWANGTGYFDHAVDGEHAPKFDVLKKHYTFKTDTGRQGLIFPTPHGNVVVFQRYYNARHVLAANMPRLCEIFFVSGRPLTIDDLVVIGGGWAGTHIGVSIAGAMNYTERKKKYEATGDISDHPDMDSWKEVQG